MDIQRVLMIVLSSPSLTIGKRVSKVSSCTQSYMTRTVNVTCMVYQRFMKWKDDHSLRRGAMQA